MRRLMFLACLALAAVASSRAQSTDDGGWSGALLDRLIATAPAGQGSNAATADGGLILRSYQLRNLKVGAPGKSAHLTSILAKMLTADSRVTEDPDANVLHVFTTAKAHEATRELIVGMDSTADESPAPNRGGTAGGMPEEVKKALLELASLKSKNDQVILAINEASKRNAELAQQLKQQNEEQGRSNQSLMIVLVLAALGIMALIFVAFAWSSRRQKKAIAEAAALAAKQSSALVPVGSMERLLQVNHDQHQKNEEIRIFIEKMALGVQAWQHQQREFVMKAQEERNLLASQLDALKQSPAALVLNENMSALQALIQSTQQAHDVAFNAAKKMDETVAKLEVHDKKVEAVTNELAKALREQEELYRKMEELQALNKKREEELEAMRRESERNRLELVQKEATLAAVSLLMQEPVGPILDSLTEASTQQNKTQDPAAPSAPAEGESSAEQLPQVSTDSQSPAAPDDSTPVFRFSPP